MILDLSAAANIYGYFFTKEDYPDRLILPLGLTFMFLVYCGYFRLHDDQTLPDAFANAISSLVTALPLLQSEFDSVKNMLIRNFNFWFLG